MILKTYTIAILLFVFAGVNVFGQNTNNPDELDEVLNGLVELLELNPDNPLKIDKAFLADLSTLLPDGSLKSSLQSYSTNLGTDNGLSTRQVYWDVATALDQNSTIANMNQYAQMSQNLNVMFNDYSLLSEKLMNRDGNYQFGSFVTDPAIMSSLANVSGSYENAQAIGAGVELILLFAEGIASTRKFQEDYRKLANLSTQNKYVEKDVNLNNALIDSYVGIEDYQTITPMYRYDFYNGASLRVEKGILKYFNEKKGIVKNLMVVDKGHDGSLYQSKILRGYGYSMIAVSPDEKRFYMFANPEAISDVKCENCLEKCGYTFDTENGEVVYTKLGEKMDWRMSILGQPGIEVQFNQFNVPFRPSLSAGYGNFFITNHRFMDLYNFSDREYFVQYLDRDKKFDVNGALKKFKDSDELGESIFGNYKSVFFYPFVKEQSYISLIWANSLNEKLLAGDGTRFVGSMIQISKSTDSLVADYFNADAMLNEITGLAMTKAGNLFFVGKNGNIGKLNASEYQLNDPSFTTQMRSALGTKMSIPYDFIGNAEFVSLHGQLSTATDTKAIYPKLQFTPDETSLVYTIKNKLYIINPNNLNDIKQYTLSCHPYNFFFTKENGDWIINLQAQNEYKFPVVKKYSIGKLRSMDLNVKPKAASKTNSTNSNFSLADEIKKLKELLDNGAITQEEYEAGKKKLLSK